MTLEELKTQLSESRDRFEAQENECLEDGTSKLALFYCGVKAGLEIALVFLHTVEDNKE